MTPLLFIVFSFIIAIGGDPPEKRTVLINSGDTNQKEANHHWCTAHGCNLCTDDNSSCQVTCKGFTCGECPTGSCCNGKNCNACYANRCCSTSACNFCLRACRDACNGTSACEGYCVDQCRSGTKEVFVISSNRTLNSSEVAVYIKGVPYKGQVTLGQIKESNETALISLNGTKYSGVVIVLPKAEPKKCVKKREVCCRADQCSPCLERCNSKCSSRFCCRSCSRTCKPAQEEINGAKVAGVVSTKRQFNTSTVINITNHINNTNRIDIPVNVSSLNRHFIRTGCCHVSHPQQCTKSQPYQYCYQRSHQECSNLCTSKFVHIAPQQRQQNRCHYINSPPYAYCGRLSLQNCDACYVCNGQYNPEFCMKQSGCSEICRRTVSLPGGGSSFPNSQGFWPMNPYQSDNFVRALYPGMAEYEELSKLLRSDGEYVEDSV